MGDRVLGPYRQGQEVELPFWITAHLVGMGYAKLKEENQLTTKSLSTTHYKETLPGLRDLPKLPKSFYFQLRRLLKELKAQEAKDRAMGRELDKALGLARDIVGIRIRKIANLAASGEHPPELTSNLTSEEVALFEKVRKEVDSWRKEILGRDSDR